MTDFFEHIDDYVAGRLTGKALEEFEAAMYADQDLRAAVENYGVAEEVMGLMIEEDVRGVIEELEEKDSETIKTEKKTPGYKSLLIGLALAVLLALLAYAYKSITDVNDQSDSDLLYAAYYSDYISPEVRGNTNPEPTLTLCNQGHKLMQQGNLVEANTVFHESLQVEDDCTDKSQWYLSLIYLKHSDKKSLDSLVSIIAKDQNSVYQPKAIQLLKEL